MFERPSNSQTENPLLSALLWQHVHVTDGRLFVEMSLVEDVETKHYCIALDYDTLCCTSFLTETASPVAPNVLVTVFLRFNASVVLGMTKFQGNVRSWRSVESEALSGCFTREKVLGIIAWAKRWLSNPSRLVEISTPMLRSLVGRPCLFLRIRSRDARHTVCFRIVASPERKQLIWSLFYEGPQDMCKWEF